MEPITLRPHHLVRGVERHLLYEQGLDGGPAEAERIPKGDGYGDEFHTLEHETIKAIINDPNVTIRITDSWDDFCYACGRREECRYDHEAQSDTEKVTKLGFKIGQSITSGELLARMRRRDALIQCVVDEMLSGSELGKYLRSIYHELF